MFYKEILQRNFTNLLIVIVLLFFSSCEKEIEVPTDVLPCQTTVENGYLSFSDKESFNAYISQIDSSLKTNPQSLKSLNLSQQFNGFISLASKLERNQLKSETGP